MHWDDDSIDPEWWYRVYPKSGNYRTVQYAPLKKRVIYLRKLYLLLTYAQLEVIFLYLLITANNETQTYISQDEDILSWAVTGLIILLIMNCIKEEMRDKFVIFMVLIVGFLIGIIFGSACCDVILEEPSRKWNIFLFLMANVLYMTGLFCLTWKEKWHKQLVLTYALYTVAFIWALIGLVVLFFPMADIDSLVIVSCWICLIGFYITIDILFVFKGWRCENMTTNDYGYGAFILHYDYLTLTMFFVICFCKCFLKCCCQPKRLR